MNGRHLIPTPMPLPAHARPNPPKKALSVSADSNDCQMSRRHLPYVSRQTTAKKNDFTSLGIATLKLFGAWDTLRASLEVGTPGILY